MQQQEEQEMGLGSDRQSECAEWQKNESAKLILFQIY